jgi:hypothetical protein
VYFILRQYFPKSETTSSPLKHRDYYLHPLFHKFCALLKECTDKVLRVNSDNFPKRQQFHACNAEVPFEVGSKFLNIFFPLALQPLFGP